MDNTDFSFLWRKEMTSRWVGQALRKLASRRQFKKTLSVVDPRDPLLYFAPSRSLAFQARIPRSHRSPTIRQGKSAPPSGATESEERDAGFEDSVSMKLYVGNLPYNTSEDDLRSLFSTYGAVSSVAIITDRDTGRSKGFGFVEFGNDDEARNAISALSGQEYGGRALTVNEARPKTQGGGGRGGRY